MHKIIQLFCYFTDYAAHIGHTFLTISNPNPDKRALQTVEQIGGAVLQGGGSTALSIMMLSLSNAYTFRTFFKVFTIVVVFGLYFGVVFLPVILSIFAPSPYLNERHDNETELDLLDSKSKRKITIMKQQGRNSNNNCDNHENEKLNST